MWKVRLLQHQKLNVFGIPPLKNKKEVTDNVHLRPSVVHIDFLHSVKFILESSD